MKTAQSPRGKRMAVPNAMGALSNFCIDHGFFTAS
jgi:hypothetical protein